GPLSGSCVDYGVKAACLRTKEVHADLKNGVDQFADAFLIGKGCRCFAGYGGAGLRFWGIHPDTSSRECVHC
ncbi:hypothetical protein ADUPG1_002956, partial [Aduncisulcus paluster]